MAVHSAASARTLRLLALSLGGNLALALGLVLALWFPTARVQDSRSEAREALLSDPEMRQDIVRELAADALGIHDSHLDADVGRVLFAGVDQTSLRGERIVSNAFGMRERKYVLPKPEGLVRIVLLGDSLVFGHKAKAQDRVGNRLEDLLHANLDDSTPSVEVLSLGISGWNLANECAYLRRQLGLLQPDLVVHVMTDNDLDDDLGVRGVGAMATFSVAHRARGEARVSRSQLVPSAKRSFTNPLLLGLDYESRLRCKEAQANISSLTLGLEKIDCAYVPLIYAQTSASGLRDAFLPAPLSGGALCVLPSFVRNKENHVAEGDAHWGVTGAKRIAAALYSWMRAKQLPRGLALPALEQPAAAFGDVFTTGQELPAFDPLEELKRFPGLDHEFLVADLGRGEACHLYAGLSGKGVAKPFASFVLAPDPGQKPSALVLEGEALGRFELDGTEVQVSVEGQPVGSLRLAKEGSLSQRFDLPPGLASRALLNVRLEASDHVLYGAFLQESGILQLVRLALVP